jgi:murein L,D-transpeptidase YcbB/YkuD
LTSTQKTALQMNVALASHGYKQADMPLYQAFQSAVSLPADGYPGPTTMARLKGALSTVPGIAMAPVRIYPWATKPGTSGYDGINAPTWLEWTGAASPIAPAPPAPPVPIAAAPPVPVPLSQVPAAVAAPGMTHAAYDAPTAAAVVMNAALHTNSYNRADQPIYKAFQATQGMTLQALPSPECPSTRGTRARARAVTTA